MTALIEQLPKFDFFEQNFYPSIKNFLPFHWKHFYNSVFYTFRIDLLQDLDEIFKKIHTDYRNNKIPKAEKIIQITSDQSLQDFYKMQELTFGRQNLKIPFSFEFFKKYDQTLEKHNARKIFFAIDKNHRIHSSVYLIWDEHTAYYHLAGSDPSLQNSGANILLTWHVISFAKEVLRKKIFDFEGSMIEPIARVRRNFGAVQTPYLNVRKYNSSLLKILHKLKRQ